MVNYQLDDELMTTRQELLAQMRMGMGGRAAEELVFGADNVTTGASSDFQATTRLAHNMVTRYGMSEKVGHLYIAADNNREKSPPSDMKVVAEEVKKLVEASYSEALDLLQTHRVELDRLAAALLTHETLDKDEIRRVLKGERLVEREERDIREREKREARRLERERKEREKEEEAKRAAQGLGDDQLKNRALDDLRKKLGEPALQK